VVSAGAASVVRRCSQWFLERPNVWSALARIASRVAVNNIHSECAFTASSHGPQDPQTPCRPPRRIFSEQPARRLLSLYRRSLPIASAVGARQHPAALCIPWASKHVQKH
jgi:hypothetical protein